MFWPYAQTAVVLAAGAGFWIGMLTGRLRSPWWGVGYGLPLALVLLVAAARHVPALEFVPPFQWLMAGRTEFGLLGWSVPMLIGALTPRLRLRRQRVLVWVFGSLAVGYFVVLPFLVPALLRGRMASIETTVDRHGVCRQSTGYNCGPAAAVTALHHLGVEAKEGALAALSHTSPIAGTAPDTLAAAIGRRFRGRGVRAEYRMFGRVSDLRGQEPVIALIEHTFLVDHYVTVLRVTDSHVVVGDPLAGRRVVDRESFKAGWRRVGIVVDRRMEGRRRAVNAPGR